MIHLANLSSSSDSDTTLELFFKSRSQYLASWNKSLNLSNNKNTQVSTHCWQRLAWVFKEKAKGQKDVSQISQKSEVRSCVEVAILGSPSLTVLLVSVDVKQHWNELNWTLTSQETVHILTAVATRRKMVQAWHTTANSFLLTPSTQHSRAFKGAHRRWVHLLTFPSVHACGCLPARRREYGVVHDGCVYILWQQIYHLWIQPSQKPGQRRKLLQMDKIKTKQANMYISTHMNNYIFLIITN